MVAMVYLFVAVVGLVLAWRALAAAPGDPVRREFAVLALLVAMLEGSFSLVLFPGILQMRWVWAVAGACLPAATLQVIDRVSRPPGRPPSDLVTRLWIVTPLAALLFLLLDLGVWRADPGVTPPKVLLGVGTYVAFLLAIRELWHRREATPHAVERSRLGYLLVLMVAAVGTSIVEGGVRVIGLYAADLAALDMSGRSVEIQGLIPPVGVLFTGLFMYCLYLVISLERLLDLQELASHLTAVAAMAALLVGAEFVAVVWLDPQAHFPRHITFQVFVASVLFLLAYEPLLQRVEGISAQLFNRRGRQLSEALEELELAVPKARSLDELGRLLLDRLHASGRFPALSLYIHDPDRGRARRQFTRSAGRSTALPEVALKPFADGFTEGEQVYARQVLEFRRQREGGEGVAAVRLRIMDAMSADVAVPLVSGELVLGWLALEDEDWSDGLAHDELQGLRDLADQAAVVLENLRNFEAVKEQARLAVMGTMSAGLAHEIRNPLAGIKGAAQFLQGEELPPASQDFLQIILDEVERLSTVVSGFLDYARPFDLEREPTEVNATVSHVLSLIRAEGLPPGIELVEDLAGDLPRVNMDAGKIQQVLFNLVRNAIQAMPEGGRVRVATRRGMHDARTGTFRAVRLVVQDEGAGIPREALKDLFVPFYTTKPGGTGLGLAICQRIIKAHGGELKVRSTPGRGSVFAVVLRSEEPT